MKIAKLSNSFYRVILS